MAPNPRRQDERLDALYARLPRLECKGLCHDSCGPLDGSIGTRERARVEQASGRKLTCGSGPTCSMLTDDRRCSVYDERPLICRLWGIAEYFPCPYGCVPEGGHLHAADAFVFMEEMLAIAGNPEPGPRLIEGKPPLERVRELASTDEGRRRARAAARLTIIRPSLGGRNVPASVIEAGAQGEH